MTRYYSVDAIVLKAMDYGEGIAFYLLFQRRRKTIGHCTRYQKANK